MLVPMNRFFVLLGLLLASCTSSNQLQVRSVTVPSNQDVAADSASQILETARKSGGKVRTWKVPLEADGDFAFADQKRSFFVTAYDPPTATHPRPRPVEYDSKMVGVSIKGKVAMTERTSPEVRLTFEEIQKRGVIRYGPDVEQPVFLTRSLQTSILLDGSEWAVVSQPTAAKDPEKHYLLLRAPLANK